jgi:peptide/nickel transport system substrate-binding protein
MHDDLSRRGLLRIAGMTAASAALASGCSLLSTAPTKKKGPTAGAAGAKEAPALAAQVEAGKLPPLPQRLPAKPMVVEPLSEKGQYGGILRYGTIDRGWAANTYLTWTSLVEWTPTTPPEPGPALAESWEIENDGRVFVFHLREGLKWSDGKPFTTDDLMFAYNDVFLNEELNPVFPAFLSSAGKPAKFVQVDKQTLRMEFEVPNGLLLRMLCFQGMSHDLLHPAHYMKQFHKKYASPADLKAAMKKYSAATWMDLYAGRHDIWLNAAFPVLAPWKISQPLTSAGTTARVERNPYYWKVDPDGRQLPYIDGAVFTVLTEETLGLRAASGDLDLDLGGVNVKSRPLLLQREESEPYKVLRYTPDGYFYAVNLNQSHPDPVLRKLFSDVQFRAGLSHSINRQEMNDALLAGQGTMKHPCAQPEDPYFIEGMGERYTAFDLAKANEYLDDAGLTRRGSNGFRLRPDGKPMKLVATTFGEEQIAVLEYVKRYFAKAGIDLALRVISRTLWYEQIPQGDFDICGYPTAGYLWDIDALWYVPTNGYTYWCPKFGQWYSDPNGKFSEKPTGEIRQLQVLFDDLQREVDDQARLELGQDILELHDKNVWIIGTIRPPFIPVTVNEDLRNIPPEGVVTFRGNGEAVMNMPQVFYANPDKHA